MKKHLLLHGLLLLFAGSIYAQAQAYEGKVAYRKTQQTAAVIELPYPVSVLEDAIKDYLAKKGTKPNSSNGFTTYRSTPVDSDSKDLFFDVEKKGRKDRDISVIYLIVTNQHGDPLAQPAESVPGNLEVAKNFLNSMVPSLEAYSIDLNIKDQDEIVKKAQKKYNNLLDDQSDLEKKIRKLEADLDENKKNQVKQTQEMQNNLQQDDDATKKAAKKMSKLVDDQASMQKKLRNVQNDLDNNKKDQDKQKTELEKQQQILDAIKAKRK